MGIFRGAHIRFFLFWLAAGFCEGLFFYFLDRNWPPAIGAHLAACLILFFSVPRGPGWFHPERKWGVVFLLLAGFFPILGWLASAVLYAAVSRAFAPSAPGEEEAWMFEPGIRPIFVSHTATRRERIARELDFLPLSDILAGEDPELKRGAVEKLAQLKTPEAVRILLTHRGDSSMEVRFYATSALARIKREFDEDLEAAKKQMKKDVYKISGRIFLAKIYLQYACSGLLDPVTANAYEVEARYHLDFSLQSEFAGVEAFRMLMDIYLRGNDWDRAALVADLLEKRGKTTPEELAKIRIDILYHSGQFTEIPAAFSSQSAVFSDPQWQAMANWWRG